ncbi:MAG: hypothetical protein IKB13_06530 [Clostridia bacterium]|nr:hypothetical protein [Clostridia bacterium]
MKKAISLLLALVLCLSLCACSGGESTSVNTVPPAANTDTEASEPPVDPTEAEQAPIYTVAEAIPSEFFPFTITRTEFSQYVSTKTEEDFLSKEYAAGVGAYAADKGYQWLFYDIEYTYAGKTSMSLVSSLFRPTVTYGEYTFNSDYFTFIKIDNKWYILDYDYSGVNHPLHKNLSMNSLYKYEPLDGKEYEVRGIIKVPTQAVEDTETPMYLNVFNVTEASQTEIIVNNVTVEIDRNMGMENFDEVAQEEIITNRNRDFVEAYLDRFTKLSGEQISEALIGEWYSTKGNLEIFKEDGTYIAGNPDDSMVYDVEFPWSVVGDCIDIGGAEWEVYQLYEDVYYIRLTNPSPSGNILIKKQ